jgi:hypothetical protein
MYNAKHLEWHLGGENIVRTPQVSVWSCQVASESFDYVFKRLAAAHAKSQDHRVTFGVFSFGADRTPSVSNAPSPGGVEEKGCRFSDDPDGVAFRSDHKNEQLYRLSAAGPRQGRSTIGIRRFASSRPFSTGVNEHGQ